MLLRTPGVLALLFAGVAFLDVAAYAQHDHDTHAADASAPDPPATARCPIDGMKMRASGMTPLAHEGGVLYFCSQAQADMFASDPDRYYKTSTLGDMTLHMSVLTVDEYVSMMDSMGMARMVDAAKLADKTHHVSVWITAGDGEPDLKGAGLALRVVSGGEASTTALRYNTMMKTYDAAIAARGDGEQKLAVVITTPPVSL